jgi:hypothetical protein
MKYILLQVVLLDIYRDTFLQSVEIVDIRSLRISKNCIGFEDNKIH